LGINVLSVSRTYTMSHKNVTTLYCHSFDIHESILVIFGRTATFLENKQLKMFCFPPPTASALPGEMLKHKNRIFSLMLCCQT